MRLVIVLAAVVAFAFSAEGDDCTLSREDLAAVRAADAAYVSAWLKNDRDALLSLLVADAVIVPQNSAPIAGIAKISEFWWPRSGTTTVRTFESAIAEADGCGDLAFTRGAFNFSFDWQSGETVQRLANRGNYMMLYRRSGGSWKITHRMWSDLPR